MDVFLLKPSFSISIVNFEIVSHTPDVYKTFTLIIVLTIITKNVHFTFFWVVLWLSCGIPKNVLSQKNHIVGFLFFFLGFFKMCGKLWLLEYIVRLLLWFSHVKKKKKEDFQDIFLLMDFLKAHLLFFLTFLGQTRFSGTEQKTRLLFQSSHPIKTK